jgi:hypothetical protein
MRGDCRTDSSTYAPTHDRAVATTHFRAYGCTNTAADGPTEYRVAIDSQSGHTRE